jgi:hypothetical protein
VKIPHLFRANFYIYFIALALLNHGCAVFHPEKLEREGGYYTRHFNSCGPVAIQDALSRLEGYVTQKEISKEIQNNGNGRRVALTLIHYDALWITWPSELKKYFTDRGYKVTSTNLNSLTTNDIAIVLIKGSSLRLEWHWITYPTYTTKQIKNLYKQYGRNTSVIAVYKIEK